MNKVDKSIKSANAAWSFNGIADEFDEHISKSVPLYDAGHELICQVSDFFIPSNAVITEIGVSTGTLAGKLLKHHADRKDIKYLAIDNIESMINKAKSKNDNDQRVEFLVDDVSTYQFNKSSLIISYYTLQFVHPKYRQEVFNRIYEALDWGGAFLLFEKVRAPDARFQDMMVQVYNDYKLTRNFSESEIINKTRSLKGILEPFSTQGNHDLMKRAGFTDIMTIMKWVCFEGFLAIK